MEVAFHVPAYHESDDDVCMREMGYPIVRAAAAVTATSDHAISGLTVALWPSRTDCTSALEAR